MRRLGIALCLACILSPAHAGLDATPPAPDLSPYAKTTDLAPYAKTGSPSVVCGVSPIPASNMVTGAAGANVETPFGSVCTIKSALLVSGAAFTVQVGGNYGAATAAAATGKVRYYQSASANLSTDQTPVNTTALNGIAGATYPQEWWGEVRITVQPGGTAIDVQAKLTFQATTPVDVMLGNTATYPIDGTKDLNLYLTVTWSTNAAANKMELRTLSVK